MLYKNKRELNAGVKKWKKLLRLQDWTFTAALTPNRDINGHIAMCSVSIPRKHSFLHIGSTEKDQAVAKQCHEASLIHEMLHCHFESFRPDDEEAPLEYEMWEQAIDQLSVAFRDLAAQSRK